MGRRIYREIVREIDVRGKEVLELGCGTGELLRQAAEAGARLVTAVDISREALARAGQMLRGFRHRLLLQDLFCLTGARVADIVWSSGLVEHFTSARMLEVLRIHRRLARQHVVVLAPASPHLNDLRTGIPRLVRAFGFQRPLSKARLRALGRAAGLRPRAVRRIMPEYGLGRYYSVLPGAVRRGMEWAGNWCGGLVLAWYDVP